MPTRLKHSCNKIGCPNLTYDRYCPECSDKYGKQEQKAFDHRRGTASNRGYGSIWNKQSKYFKSLPENQFCYIQGPNCSGLVECTEHIIPPKGPDDPLFKDPNNRAPSCIPCNSWKGHRTIQKLIIDEADYFKKIGHNPIEYLREMGKII